MYYGILTFWDKRGGTLDIRGIFNKHFTTRIRGPLYPITSCFDNSTLIPNHNWISLIHPDPKCPGLLETGARADIVTQYSPLLNQTRSIAISISDTTMEYLYKFSDLDVELVDNNRNFIVMDDIIPNGLIIICIIILFVSISKRCYTCYKNRPRFRRKKYTLSEPEHCTICIEGIEKNQYIKELPCKHTFHDKCIDEWLTKKKVCPNCNCPTEIESGELTPLIG
jgi:hypothetical protein